MDGHYQDYEKCTQNKILNKFMPVRMGEGGEKQQV